MCDLLMPQQREFRKSQTDELWGKFSDEKNCNETSGVDSHFKLKNFFN